MIDFNFCVWDGSQKIEKNKIYKLLDSCSLFFQENHDDESVETVEIKYNMEKSQYGLYAHEYRPSVIKKKNAKTADILACLIDEDKKKIWSFIYDVKKNISAFSDDLLRPNAIITAIKQIRDFINQINAEMLHKDSFMLYYLNEGYKEKESVGIITTNFEKEKFVEAADQFDDLVTHKENNISILLKNKLYNSLLPYRGEADKIRAFSKGQLLLDKGTYELNVILLAPKNHKEFVCDLIVSEKG